jgi:hypothetical protein
MSMDPGNGTAIVMPSGPPDAGRFSFGSRAGVAGNGGRHLLDKLRGRGGRGARKTEWSSVARAGGGNPWSG